MNLQAILTLFKFEMLRTFRTPLQSILSPVISTALYFVVFGSAIGSRMQQVDNVSYGTFIVPGLLILSILTQSISNASFAIYFPRFTNTIFEILSAPVSFVEVVSAYVGASAAKSVMLAVLILVTAWCFVDLHIAHPFWMALFILLSAFTFSLLGFIIGIWAESFEQLQLVPLLIVTPLTFLSGSFYSLDMLPPFWRGVSLFNPVVYLVSMLRWSFFDKADVNITVSVAVILAFTAICLGIVAWTFRTGYRIKA